MQVRTNTGFLSVLDPYVLDSVIFGHRELRDLGGGGGYPGF
jgi:hypothetical protein